MGRMLIAFGFILRFQSFERTYLGGTRTFLVKISVQMLN